MWFKNMKIYRLPTSWVLSSHDLETYLLRHIFQTCTDLQMISQGWIAPRHDALVHVLNDQFLLTLQTEKKLLPKSVITRFSRMASVVIEKQQGFALGRKQRKDVEDQVIDELLPRAFPVTTRTNVWIDKKNGWLGIDTASASKADEIIGLLMHSIDQMPLQYLRTNLSPLCAMTNWLDDDEAPEGFTIDRESELRTKDKVIVRYVNHALDADEMRHHIARGKKCTRLAMTWNDRVSFVLTEDMSIKRITPLNVLKEAPPIGNHVCCGKFLFRSVQKHLYRFCRRQDRLIFRYEVRFHVLQTRRWPALLW